MEMERVEDGIGKEKYRLYRGRTSCRYSVISRATRSELLVLYY